MSGIGQRFINAGFETIKPLILVEGKPIIQHVIERFCVNDDYIFICNENHLKTTELEAVLTKLRPEGKIVPIKPHKYGPVYAVHKSEEFIDSNKPSIVNYCDFSWRWNYKEFINTMVKTNCDGCIVAYRDFHPHLLGPNLYASMLDDGQNCLKEIREKFTFTNNKMDCFQSSGTYYFKNGEILKTNFQELVDNGPTLNGEFYVSLVYNKMVAKNLSVYIYKIPIFLQWGTPEDLEEYIYWSDYFLSDTYKV